MRQIKTPFSPRGGARLPGQRGSTFTSSSHRHPCYAHVAPDLLHKAIVLRRHNADAAFAHDDGKYYHSDRRRRAPGRPPPRLRRRRRCAPPAGPFLWTGPQPRGSAWGISLAAWASSGQRASSLTSAARRATARRQRRDGASAVGPWCSPWRGCGSQRRGSASNTPSSRRLPCWP